MNILKRLQIHALLIALSLFVPFSSGAIAQENTGSGASTTLPEALGPEAMQSLVSKLDSEQTEALAGLVAIDGFWLVVVIDVRFSGCCHVGILGCSSV